MIKRTVTGAFAGWSVDWGRGGRCVVAWVKGIRMGNPGELAGVVINCVAVLGSPLSGLVKTVLLRTVPCEVDGVLL